jgi:hypothetical protein
MADFAIGGLTFNMTVVQSATLVSAGLGFSGTIFLFLGTYGFQPFEGGVFGSPEMQAHNARVRAKNKTKKINQRIGLALLSLSFAVQAIAVFIR